MSHNTDRTDKYFDPEDVLQEPEIALGSVQTPNEEEQTARSMGVSLEGPSLLQRTDTAAPKASSGGSRFMRAQPTQKDATPIGPVATAMKWSTTSTNIPTKPEYHPLERTAVFAEHTSAEEVVERVCKVIRARSIDVLGYDLKKAKAKCVTQDNVDFRVRFYRGRKTYSHGIIVEVQRRYGFAISFYADTAAILKAAKGEEYEQPDTKSPFAGDKFAVDEYDESAGSQMLEVVSTMLNEDRTVEEHRLALQTLKSITDSNKMGETTAKKISEKLLTNENTRFIRDVILGFGLSDRTDSYDEADEEYERRSLALSVLANVLSNASRDALQSIQAPAQKTIIPTLTEDIANAENQVRMAHLAARCMEPLIAKGFQLGNDSVLREAIIAAQLVGQARYAGLEIEAARCLKVLG